MLTELAALLDLLKAKGVSHYEGPGMAEQENGIKRMVCIDFAPIAPPEEKPDAKTADPDMCSCGHSMTLHQGSACLEGCEEEKCST